LWPLIPKQFKPPIRSAALGALEIIMKASGAFFDLLGLVVVVIMIGYIAGVY
jgi:hypothetical protein